MKNLSVGFEYIFIILYCFYEGGKVYRVLVKYNLIKVFVGDICLIDSLVIVFIVIIFVY